MKGRGWIKAFRCPLTTKAANTGGMPGCRKAANVRGNETNEQQEHQLCLSFVTLLFKV